MQIEEDSFSSPKEINPWVNSTLDSSFISIKWFCAELLLPVKICKRSNFVPSSIRRKILVDIDFPSIDGITISNDWLKSRLTFKAISPKLEAWLRHTEMSFFILVELTILPRLSSISLLFSFSIPLGRLIFKIGFLLGLIIILALFSSLSSLLHCCKQL